MNDKSGSSPDVIGLQRALAAAGLRTDVPFARPELMAEALTHASCEAPVHNQRLEMLGDAVLGFVVADMLYHQLPQAPEGVLTRVRSALVDEGSLAELSRRLGLGALIALGKGEAQEGGRDRASLLADLFEAVVAALYLSEGLSCVRSVVTPLLHEQAQQLAEAGVRPTDWKTLLQERSQALVKKVPAYELLEASGPDHARLFRAAVSLCGLAAGEGAGRTRKQAEQAAAREALERWDTLSVQVTAVAATAKGR